MRQSFGTLHKGTFVHVGLAGPNTSILGLQKPIAFAFSLAIGLRNDVLAYDF